MKKMNDAPIYDYQELIIEEMRKELINQDQYIGKLTEAYNNELKRLNKALLDIKELVVNNACLSESDNKCVDDLIYYKCDELLDIVNKALGSDKE